MSLSQTKRIVYIKIPPLYNIRDREGESQGDETTSYELLMLKEHRK